ncbi:activating signal cointegrator 1 complex subunit 1 isoform 3-T3 [Alca torda]
MPTGGRNRWRAPRSLFIKTSWQGLYFKEGEARRGLHLHRLSAVAPTILAPGGGGGGGKRVVTTLRMRGALPTLRAGGGLSSASAHARRPAHTPSGRGLNSATAHARPQAPPLPAFRNQPLPGPGDCADEPCDAFVVEETEKGFQCRVEVPSPLYKYIIGKKGETKKKLETETRTSISIPKPGVEGEIVITGQHRSGVVSARTRIDVLLDSFRKKQPFTHFLSFVLNQPAIQEKFLQFKEEVLEKCSKDHGVTSSLFQNPAKLHLTLGTLVLLNEQEIQKACDLLQRCKEDFADQIAGGKPLTVEVAGVEYMNDDPAMMDVLYAKVHMKDGSDRLQVIADQLVERFVASGLMLKEWDRVKLHATVMNTLFRKDPSALRELLLRGGAAGLGASLPEVLLGRLWLLRDVWAAHLLLKRQRSCHSGSARR